MIVNVFKNKHFLWLLSYVHIWRRVESGGTETLIHLDI